MSSRILPVVCKVFPAGSKAGTEARGIDQNKIEEHEDEQSVKNQTSEDCFFYSNFIKVNDVYLLLGKSHVLEYKMAIWASQVQTYRLIFDVLLRYQKIIIFGRLPDGPKNRALEANLAVAPPVR